MRLRRHLLVALLAVGSISCTSGSEPSQSSASTLSTSTPSTTVDLEVVEIPAETDAVREPGGAAVTSGSRLVVKPVTGSALLSFPVTGLDPSCVTEAVLTIPLAPTSMAVDAWVSVETELHTLRDGDSLGASVVAGGSPSAKKEPGTAGHAAWDVLDLLTWSRENQADSSRFVVALKPQFAAGTGALEFGASEGDEPAVLRIERRMRCP